MLNERHDIRILLKTTQRVLNRRVVHPGLPVRVSDGDGRLQEVLLLLLR